MVGVEARRMPGGCRISAGVAPPRRPEEPGMDCPECPADNRDGARFCRDCGGQLTGRCPRSGVPVAAGSNFCDACGLSLGRTPDDGSAPAHLDAPASYTPRHLAERIVADGPALEGQRKQVTVLFCDIANSTGLA